MSALQPCAVARHLAFSTQLATRASKENITCRTYFCHRFQPDMVAMCPQLLEALGRHHMQRSQYTSDAVSILKARSKSSDHDDVYLAVRARCQTEVDLEHTNWLERSAPRFDCSTCRTHPLSTKPAKKIASGTKVHDCEPQSVLRHCFNCCALRWGA